MHRHISIHSLFIYLLLLMMEEPWQLLDAANLFGYVRLDCCTQYAHVLHTNTDCIASLHIDMLQF